MGLSRGRYESEEDLTGAKVARHLVVDLALGGGRPVEKAPEPSTMIVDYVRVYAKE